MESILGLRSVSRPKLQATVLADPLFPAPLLIAGVVAELLAIGEIPTSMGLEGVYLFLTTVAGWRRPKGGEYVIWDLVPVAVNPQVWGFLITSLVGSMVKFSDARLTGRPGNNSF